MMPELREFDFEFMSAAKIIISRRQKQNITIKGASLSEIQEKVGTDWELWKYQKTLKKLESAGLVKSERIGRQRIVKLTMNGVYFLEWYRRNKK